LEPIVLRRRIRAAPELGPYLNGGRDMKQATQVPFETLYEEWHDWMRQSRNLAPNTIHLYGRTVLQAHEDLGDLLGQTTESLEAWARSRGGQAGTYNNRVCALTSFYRFLVKTKRLPANPATEMDRPKQPKRLPKPVQALASVLAQADLEDARANEKGSIQRRVGETRDMIVFLCETGLRIHEAVACNWPVPCPTEMTITGKGRKEAMIPITQKAQNAWNRLEGKWPIGARATQRRFERLGISPHMCRHWRATSLVQAGVDIGTVSKIMRHEGVNTTMGYSAFATEQFREALGKVG
jgi:integrase/recombinase XerC